MEIFKNIGFIAGSYLIGAIPFCYLLGKMVSGKKLTEIGDNNPGGWNLVFNVSKLWGFIGIVLDIAKGYFAYFLAYRFTDTGSIGALYTTNNQLIAVLAGCAAVAGHNYSPYLKWRGGKGLATYAGLVVAAHPLNLFIGPAAILIGLVVAKNMIWAVSMAIIFPGIFLIFFKDAIIFAVMTLLLLGIMIPKQINHSISIGLNFKFRKEATLKDLFKPKIR
jgi:acyl phosphate:glycerol-3-phosphate acyltransferase